MLFLQRMRTPADRAHVARAFQQAWGVPLPDLSRPTLLLAPDALSIGWARLPRDPQGGAAVCQWCSMLRWRFYRCTGKPDKSYLHRCMIQAWLVVL
jgi:hypothetical protein